MPLFVPSCTPCIPSLSSSVITAVYCVPALFPVLFLQPHPPRTASTPCVFSALVLLFVPLFARSQRKSPAM
ncbi:hypothetical protein J3E69DRAFT_326190, partial [Trichoderma sp. SZMC 28015]